MRTSIASAMLCAVSMLAALGCEENKMSMEEMMAQPQRPPELDRLSAFMGKWRGEYDMKITGVDETMTGEGDSTVSWAIDNRYMVENTEFTMAGNPVQGMAYWTWDDKSGVYRNWWFDSYGYVGTGTARYDENDNVWRMKGSGRSMVTGQKTVGEGTVEFVDADTMKWDYAEWDSLHLIKQMEMHGTSRRQ